MRNIYFFFILVIMFISFPLYADDSESRYAFSMEIHGGFLWGIGSEIVYARNNHFNSSPFESELLWDFKPLFYTGLSLDFSPRNPFSANGFHISLGIKYGLPLNTGIIENRDWLATGHDYLTHYSRHDAFAGYTNFLADLTFGYSIAIHQNIWIKPYAELSYLRFSWEARDGYFQYGNRVPGPGIRYEPSLPSTPKVPVNGTVITYTQNWIIFAPGFEAGIRFSDNFNVLLSTALSPIVYGFHIDDHILRETIFQDEMFGGLYIKGSLALEYFLNKKIALCFSASYMNVSRTRGNTEVSNYGSPYSDYYPDISGGEFSFWDFGLALRYIF